MSTTSRLAAKAAKKPPFKSVRETVAEKAAARKEAATFKTVEQLKKEAVEAKPSMRKAVEPTGSAKQGAAAAAALGTAGLVLSQMPKKGAPTAEAKGRRGGRTGSAYTAGPAESKASVTPAKPAASAPKAKDGNTTAPAPKAKQVLAGREVKNGKVFVSAEELKKSGLSLRDFLNQERKLKRREDKSTLKPLKTLEEDKKALAEKRAKDEARKKEVAAKVKAAGLAKGGMAKYK